VINVVLFTVEYAIAPDVAGVAVLDTMPFLVPTHVASLVFVRVPNTARDDDTGDESGSAGQSVDRNSCRNKGLLARPALDCAVVGAAVVGAAVVGLAVVGAAVVGAAVVGAAVVGAALTTGAGVGPIEATACFQIRQESNNMKTVFIVSRSNQVQPITRTQC
jgi:hypothetical protein